MSTDFHIERPDSMHLVVSKSRKSATIETAGFLSLFLVWYIVVVLNADSPLVPGALLGDVIWHPERWAATARSLTEKEWGGLFLLVIPLFVLSNFIKTIRVAVLGDTIEFDSTARSISKNGKLQPAASGIASVEMRSVDSNDTTKYRLAVVYSSGASLHVIETRDQEQAAHAADDIARFLGTRVINTDKK